MYNKNITKLMYVAKCVDIESTQYSKSTPNDILYENMDLFINGEGTETNKKKASEKFLKTSKMSMKDLKIHILIFLERLNSIGINKL